MKLAPRLTYATAACGIILFGGGGLLQLREQRRDVRTMEQNEALLLGRSLQVAFENALRDRHVEEVAETLTALSRVDPAVAIYVYDEEGRLAGASKDAKPTQHTVRIQELARASVAPTVEFSEEEEPFMLRVGLRLREEAPDSPSAIVLEKPLSEMARELESMRQRIIAVTFSFVVAVAGLTWLLTRRYVSVPLARMVADMRRVRAGNLRLAEVTHRGDEVGDSQLEFELLVQDLEATRVRADQEVEARQAIERGLQNADKLITLGQLAAVMAHEIGSPLQVLEGRARALRKHADDSDATRRTADMLIEQTGRITRIVEQMLSITRRRTRLRAMVDAEQSVRGVVSLLDMEARRRKIHLMVELFGPCDVYANADQLQQVALNLIRNAIEAAPPGTTVTVRLGGNERQFVLEVIDEGSGIADSVRPHLFVPFFTTKAEAGGNGLGLSVVKTIAQEHGGDVEFPSSNSGGCSVKVTFPRKASGFES